MRNKPQLVRSALLVILTGLLVGLPIAPLEAQQQNLLSNPGFEEPYSDGVANGWSRWYEDSGDACADRPEGWDFVCRPAWGPEHDYNNLGLTMSGVSQHVGAQYITWHGGVMQTVEVPAGSRVRFTAHGYSRASNDQPPDPSYGGNWVPHMQVGIDPEGRGNWYEGVVWSAENNASDSWQTISVEATVGGSGKVSVFVSSRFRRVQPLAHMDTWWDNATLEVVDTPTPPPPPQPTAPPQPTIPPVTATPRPDGSVVHTVVSGDTLFGIALQYDVDVDTLRELNAGSLGPNDMLSVGQEIVIAVPEETAEPTPEATEAPPESEATPEAPPETGGEGEAPVAEGGTASLCVSAYHDRNTDTTLQPDNEELLPNASLTLVGTNGPAGTYTTDGISEPYCFQNLQPGNYVLRQSPPAGYTPTGPGEWGVMLGEGQIHSLQIGYVRGETAPTEGGESPADAGEDVEAEPEVEEGGGLSNILDVVIRVSGIIVLILAVIIAGLFIVSRRA